MATCGICLETLGANQCNITTKCEHSYHNKCLTHWLINKNTCPLCRSNINFNNKITIGNLYGCIVTPEKYLSQDKMSDCLNHNLIINKPFGVTIYCQDCDKTHCFNWIN